MNAVLKPITIAVIELPKFDNTRLDNEGLWILDNSPALARYWQQLGRALGLEDSDGEEDLAMWLAQQHTQEWNRVHSDPDEDPTPWCLACGSKTKAKCKCGPLARND